ncbi:MAG: alginate O-acetyltransferase AlgX-related protein [Gemmatimonadales bacterium]
MTRSRLRAALLNSALVLAGIGVPLAGLEAYFRFAAPQRPGIYAPDSVLLHRLVPRGMKVYRHHRGNGGGRVNVYVNPDGFRGPPLRRDGDAPRVLVYGDSFIEGEFVPDRESYPRVLERYLRAARGDSVEVVNAGVIGYGPDQVLLRMERELDRLKPAGVVVAVFADNDLGDLVRNRIFRLAADSTLVRNRYVLSPAIRRYLGAWSRPTGLRRLHLVRWGLRRMEDARGSIADVAAGLSPEDPRPPMDQYLDWSLRRSAATYRSFVEQGSDTVTSLLGDHYDADIALTPDAPSARYKLAVMERVLGEMRRLLEPRGIAGLVLIIPSPVDICESYDPRVDSTAHPRYDRRRQSREIEAMARRQGLRVLNLWEPFREAGACALYYRYGDNHWNAAGQLEAARATRDSLLFGTSP